MRGASLLGMFVFLTSIALGACAGPPPPGHCPGTSCGCQSGDNCVLDCPAAGCDAECSSVSNCDAGCGDMCNLSCHDNSNCDLECLDACSVQCESVSNCEVECGADCAVECRNLSNCDVVMISGEVVCESVSSCDVRCALPDGSTEPATDCGDGRHSCPVGSC
jgi:hypothetical protein